MPDTCREGGKNLTKTWRPATAIPNSRPRTFKNFPLDKRVDIAWRRPDLAVGRQGRLHRALVSLSALSDGHSAKDRRSFDVYGINTYNCCRI
jgi:hypothetical protein